MRGVQAYRFQATAATISASSQPDSSVLHITGSTVASSFVCSECKALVGVSQSQKSMHEMMGFFCRRFGGFR